MKRITIIGGGLAGLVAGIELAHAGIPCILVEKKSYPFHRVCGEYLSNEVVPYLHQRGLFPDEFNPPQIKTFELSTIDGESRIMELDMGGIGISRYSFDNHLYKKAAALGVAFRLNTEVTSVTFDDNVFQVKAGQLAWEADVVIGSFGKRSRIDRSMNRSFLARRSPYVGVKHHIRTEHPDELIALHNFPGGYCGISNIEHGKSVLCYLTHVSNVRRHKSIVDVERHVLMRNPLLRRIFNESVFLFDKPEVINEVSFETKVPVEDHMLMAGDAAGMIAPLCGNGMAMAIQSARLLSAEVIHFVQGKIGRDEMEQNYRQRWQQAFSGRLWRGRQLQKLFGRELTSRIAVSLVMNIPPLARSIIKNTHGQPF